MTVLDWILDSDPAIRWHALRDLAGAPADHLDRGALPRSKNAAFPHERLGVARYAEGVEREIADWSQASDRSPARARTVP